MTNKEFIEDLKLRIAKSQKKRDNYHNQGKGGMCLVMTGRIEAFNEIISVLKTRAE